MVPESHSIRHPSEEFRRASEAVGREPVCLFDLVRVDHVNGLPGADLDALDTADAVRESHLAECPDSVETGLGDVDFLDAVGRTDLDAGIAPGAVVGVDDGDVARTALLLRHPGPGFEP